MTKRAWTGSREPPGGFTRDEILTIALDVAHTIEPGDEIGQGGCSGVDEIVLRTASLLRDVQCIPLTIVTYPADGERTWEMTRAPMDVILRSDKIHWREPGWGYLERDRALVNWAEEVRAFPLHMFKYRPSGLIVPVRGSGTAYTAAYAQLSGKLVKAKPIRYSEREAQPGAWPAGQVLRD